MCGPTQPDKLQARVEAAEKELQDFVYMASHDLNEPIRMIVSFLKLLETRHGDALNEEGRHFLDYAVDNAERLREMLQNLLVYSRIETRPEPFAVVDANATLAEACARLEYVIHAEKAVISSDPLPVVWGGEQQLTQLFYALLDNAIKFHADKPPRVHVTAGQPIGGFVEFRVCDNGLGIASCFHEDVFTIFRKLHPKHQYPGTGCGLAISRRIVRRHGGEIRVEASDGEGSTFCFTLPEPPGEIDTDSGSAAC
jgi:chemotaxis family two-component system sensor kinase Cph1